MKQKCGANTDARGVTTAAIVCINSYKPYRTFKSFNMLANNKSTYSTRPFNITMCS